MLFCWLIGEASERGPSIVNPSGFEILKLMLDDKALITSIGLSSNDPAYQHFERVA